MFVEEKAKGEVKELDAASKLLLKAADLMEKEGWCRYSYGFLHRGPYCIRGAVINAGNLQGLDYTVVPRAALDRLDKATSDQFGCMHWNDKYATSKAEVVAKLRAAAFSC